jgi:TIR domain
MKVFISWSGDLSKNVAVLLSTWLEDVLQGTKVWLSEDDIDKGKIWFGAITEQLSDTGLGILCLTLENRSSPWILFEAGALSKGLSESRVCPFLIDLQHGDLWPPLSQFNGTLPNKEDTLKLVKTINGARGDEALKDDKLLKSFNRCWSEFEEPFKEILANDKPKEEGKKRSRDDILEEILELSRSIQRSLQEHESVLRSWKQVRNMLYQPAITPLFPPPGLGLTSRDSERDSAEGGAVGAAARAAADVA